jgi:arginine decarboxylase
MGMNVHIVIEMPGELALVLDRAQRSGVTPKLGVRARLSSRAGGHWDGSGGDRSKFGLDPAQIVAVVDRLKELGHAGLPAAAALPPGQPGAGHPPHPHRGQ